MVTKFFRDNGVPGIRFFGWLAIALAASILLCDGAWAQTTKKKDKKEKEKEAAGPLGGLGATPVTKKAAVVEEPVVADDPVEQSSTKYEEMEVDEGLKKNVTKVNSMLTNGKFAAGEKELFNEYFDKFVLAKWTQVKDIAGLPKFRDDLGNQLKKKSSAAEVHDHLNALVLEFMQNLAAGPYHPAVQINAMLMIGELNSVESPVTPLPEALTVLVASASNAKLTDAVRAAAMVGIHRHVVLGIADAEARKTLSTAMLKLAAEDLPGGPTEAGREWIQAQAIDVLGRLGAVGDSNAVFKVLVRKLADAKLSLSTRSIAAESLGRLNYANAAGINALETAAIIGQFVVDACSEELKMVKELEAKDAEQGVSRRRMKRQLNAALTALAGGEDKNRKSILSLVKDPAQQNLLAALQKNIEAMTTIIDDKKSENEDLKKGVEELRSKLDSWLKKNRGKKGDGK